MKKNFNMIPDIRNKWSFWLLLLSIVLIFTISNNYFFYSFVGLSGHKDAKQLELILIEDLKYFRINTISDKKYRGHTKVIIENFAENAQYNKRITLEATLNKNGEVKKGYESWEKEKPYEKVVQTTIDITLPKLNSNEDLKYITNFKEVSLLEKEFLLSVYRSITLSIPDLLFIEMPKIGFIGIIEKWWNRYRYRSHNPIFFGLVLYIVFFRIRRHQIELHKEIDELSPLPLRSDIKEIINCIKSNDEKKLSLLIKDGITIDTKDSEGMTGLMLYMLSDESDADKRKGIEILLRNGANIDARNNSNETALFLCTEKNDDTTVKILIDNKADTTIKQETSVYDIASPEIKKLLNKARNNYVHELVKLLTNFRKDTPIKYTTHDWDDEKFKYDWDNQYGDFKGYLLKVKEQWEIMDNDLKKLSPILHTKIYNFLINDKNDYDSWCSRDGDNINIGWSSLEGLEQWVNDGNDPFDFEIKNYKIDGNTINCFGDIIAIFKREIQVRTGELKCIREKDMLKSVFKNLNKNFNFNLDFTNFTQQQFYADVATFKSVLNILFKQFSEESQYTTIKIESSVDSEDKYYILKVTQVGSFRNESIKNMLSIVDGGDFSKIKNNLLNLCDWSVESKNTNENYRINYLKSDDRDEIETNNISPIGYTHIFRFYK